MTPSATTLPPTGVVQSAIAVPVQATAIHAAPHTTPFMTRTRTPPSRSIGATVLACADPTPVGASVPLRRAQRVCRPSTHTAEPPAQQAVLGDRDRRAGAGARVRGD